MTDDELRAKLLQADAMLGEYKKLAREVGEELALSLEKHCGTKVKYSCGHPEAGCDTIVFLMNVKDWAKYFGFEMEWKDGLKHVDFDTWPTDGDA
jgi:hypothetical protein